MSQDIGKRLEKFGGDLGKKFGGMEFGALGKAVGISGLDKLVTDPAAFIAGKLSLLFFGGRVDPTQMMLKNIWDKLLVMDRKLDDCLQHLEALAEYQFRSELQDQRDRITRYYGPMIAALGGGSADSIDANTALAVRELKRLSSLPNIMADLETSLRRMTDLIVGQTKLGTFLNIGGSVRDDRCLYSVLSEGCYKNQYDIVNFNKTMRGPIFYLQDYIYASLILAIIIKAPHLRQFDKDRAEGLLRQIKIWSKAVTDYRDEIVRDLFEIEDLFYPHESGELKTFCIRQPVYHDGGCQYGYDAGDDFAYIASSLEKCMIRHPAVVRECTSYIYEKGPPVDMMRVVNGSSGLLPLSFRQTSSDPELVEMVSHVTKKAALHNHGTIPSVNLGDTFIFVNGQSGPKTQVRLTPTKNVYDKYTAGDKAGTGIIISFCGELGHVMCRNQDGIYIHPDYDLLTNHDLTQQVPNNGCWVIVPH